MLERWISRPDNFKTPNSDSLSEVMKLISSSAVGFESLSTFFTLFVELQNLANCPFLVQDLHIMPLAGHDDL